MTDKSLDKLINTLNRGQRKEHVFIRKLTDTVDLVKVFKDNPFIYDSINFNDLIPDTFYCIKNNNQYVGIVYDMCSDLHWFVKKEHRGNGYLTNALKQIILPFILQERDEQRITISLYGIGRQNFEASKKVAVNVGFCLHSELNEKYEYVLKYDDLDELDGIEGINMNLSKDELKKIAQKVFFYTKKLIRIQTNLEMCYGSGDETIFEFKERIEKIKYMTTRIEDIWYDYK